jgi:thiol:disulfide interchange protein DsbD
MMSLVHGWLLMMLVAFGPSDRVSIEVQAPLDDHIEWHFSSEQSGSEWKLLFTATIDRGWHLYSQSMEDGGPMPTEFTFVRGEGYRLLGKVMETGDVVKSYDSTFVMDVAWYEKQVLFTQRVKAKSKVDVEGEIKYSVCSKEVCVPGSVKFKLAVGK